MQTHQREMNPVPDSVFGNGDERGAGTSTRHFFSRRRMAGAVVRHVSVVAVVGVLLLGGGLGIQLSGAFAHSLCSSGDQVYVVQRGNTLGGIAARYHTSWQKLASYNHIAHPNLIYIHQTVCIPGKQAVHKGPPPVRGRGDYFPYGQCTRWAAQRYYQLHGVYVPWTTQSDAWQWTARALDFHWHVSTVPHKGDIINLQPWVEGAYGLGHVAVVERVLGNGHVIASNLNWGA
jgi:N-acetylmuramoyl-L-alanine amidase